MADGGCQLHCIAAAQPIELRGVEATEYLCSFHILPLRNTGSFQNNSGHPREMFGIYRIISTFCTTAIVYNIKRILRFRRTGVG